MYKIEIEGSIFEGVLQVDKNKFTRLVALLDNGKVKITVEILKEPKTIEEFRAWYFAMRDIVAEETGNTKSDIHEAAKNKLINGNSTTLLDEVGWKVFITMFKSWSYEYFNVYV